MCLQMQSCNWGSECLQLIFLFACDVHSIDTVWRKKAEKAQHKGRIDEMIDHPPPLSCVLSAALVSLRLSLVTDQTENAQSSSSRQGPLSERSYLFQQAPNSPLLSTIVLVS